MGGGINVVVWVGGMGGRAWRGGAVALQFILFTFNVSAVRSTGDTRGGNIVNGGVAGGVGSRKGGGGGVGGKPGGGGRAGNPGGGAKGSKPGGGGGGVGVGAIGEDGGELE